MRHLSRAVAVTGFAVLFAGAGPASVVRAVPAGLSPAGDSAAAYATPGANTDPAMPGMADTPGMTGMTRPPGASSGAMPGMDDRSMPGMASAATAGPQPTMPGMGTAASTPGMRLSRHGC